MAVFDASTSDDSIPMYDLTIVAVGSYTSQTATVLQYLSADGTTLVTLTGTFTYAGGVPASGTVSQIELDRSNDGDTDITITYPPSEYPDVLDLVASGDSFWRAALANADTFTPAEVAAPGVVFRYYYSDFINILSGEVLVAKDDTLTYGGGGGSFAYYADAGSNAGTLTAGNDTVTFNATQPTGSIYLDVISNAYTGVLIGGDDVMTSTVSASGVSASSSVLIFGDTNASYGATTGGDDTIYVLYASNATIYGDANLLSFGSLIGGNDTITGTIAGTDSLFGDVDTIEAGTTFTGGNDVIEGSNGADMIYGDYKTNNGGTIVSGGNDILSGGNGDDVIFGNEGDDTIEGGHNDDTLDGGAGSDTASYFGAFSAVTVSLALQGAQQDTIGAGLDTLTGFENLTGSRLNDILTGDIYNNVIDGGAATAAGGDDIMDGGDGVDTVSYALAEAAVSVTLATQSGVQQDTLGGGLDTLSNFENLTGSAFDDLLAGDSNDNAIDGGEGIDTANYAAAASGVAVSLALQGSAQDTVGAGIDTLSNIENILGSILGDALTGDANNNVIDGGAGTGNDTLDGGAGVDTVSYASADSAVRVALSIQAGVQQNTLGAGTDRLSNFQNLTGSGYDDLLAGDVLDNIIDGGAGTDTVSYEFAASGVDIYLTWGNVSGGAGNDSLISIEALVGSAFDDRLIGSAGTDTLTGGAGNDTIKSKGGGDLMNGGAGDDRITGGEGVDTVNGGAGVDTVTGSAGNDILLGDAGDDFLYGNGDDDILNGGADDDKLTGGKGNDLLYGNDGIDRLFAGKGDDTLSGDAGDDYLYGENGIDTLWGGAGDDSLTGGISADTFVFEQASGYDKIKDWEDGTDLIDLTNFGFSGIADVLAIAFDYTAGVRLEFADGSMLLIEGQTAAILDAGDFIF
jgi:Ca2+-binding RTX toxin-like protein